MTEGIVDEELMTDQDSHANIPVVGSHAYILSDIKIMSNVVAYRLDYRPREFKIVDDDVQYNCTFTYVTYMLVIRNTLYITPVKNNLIPPFLIGEAGIEVIDNTKIKVEDLGVEEQ